MYQGDENHRNRALSVVWQQSHQAPRTGCGIRGNLPLSHSSLVAPSSGETRAALFRLSRMQGDALYPTEKH